MAALQLDTFLMPGMADNRNVATYCCQLPKLLSKVAKLDLMAFLACNTTGYIAAPCNSGQGRGAGDVGVESK